MAADGRALQDVTINDKFAKLSEALYIAERKSREDIEMRNTFEKRAAQKEKERKEDALRNAAARAREERAGIRHDLEEEDDETLEGYQEREELRREREHERRRQRNIANAAPDKRNRLNRDADRDISERIALGLAAPNTQGGGYDTRLFGQSQGLDAGFGAVDGYSVYDAPFKGAQAQSIYKPTRKVEVSAEDEYERIVSQENVLTRWLLCFFNCFFSSVQRLLW
jgi:SNW domain-containing protein 1